jgi:hypothetical protein
MNIQTALEELDISLDEVELTNLDEEYLKKKYHKMALKWHPDKNEDKELATKKFQRIGESYNYLNNELKLTKDSEPFVSADAKIYANILTTFISSLLKGEYNELFTNVIHEIVMGYKVLSLSYLEKIFKDLDKQKSIDIYNFLINTRIFYI